ncbi:MAG: diguanylate cyclase [Acidimicrobiia bacterium]|nr:diguanylate cyclase [Acidimicrobiia bacterium]
MTVRNASPGLAAGGLGLLAGLCAVALDLPLLGLIAGGMAVAAAVISLRLARRLDEQGATQLLVEAELRALQERADDAPAEANAEPDVVLVDHDLSGEDEDDGDDEEEDGDEATAALIDHRTGLFSESFFLVALDSRIAAARRHLRPIAMVLLEVVEGLPADEPSPVDARLVADTIKDTLREADTACRLRNGYFALLLEDTPENGAIWTVERIRRQLATEQQGLTVWAGVACYPAHAFSPNEILDAAEQALVSAREWRQDRIEVAAAAD